MLTESDTFKCVPYHPKTFKFDTTKYGLLSYYDTCETTLGTGSLYSNKYTGSISPFAFSADTTQVVGYACVDFKRSKFKWIKLYGVSGDQGNKIIFNNTLYMFPTYLMPDRKTRCPYTVVYAITK